MFHPKGPTFWELARQALSSTTQGYDLLAPKFDYTPYRTMDEVIDATLRVAVAQESFGSVLDVCCGTGAAMERVLALGKVERLVGVDLSRGMLDQAAQNLAPLPPEVTLEQMDARAMTFNETFDLAVSFGAFGHIEPHDEAPFLRSIFKALKPGGRFVFATAHMPSVWSLGWWLSRGFNGAMRLRNLLPGPPFIMYYLTFMLPEIERTLHELGFETEITGDVLPAPFQGMKVVTARRPLG